MLLEAQLEKQADNQGTSEETEQVNKQLMFAAASLQMCLYVQV